MHEEFSVPPEVEREHRVIFAKTSVEKGRMTREEALEWYDISGKEFDNFKLNSPAGKRTQTQ